MQTEMVVYMLEDNAPSYCDLRNSKFFCMDLDPYQGYMSEIFDGELADEAISTNLYYLAKITSKPYREMIPNGELRINIYERPQIELEKMSAKYPVGFLDRCLMGSAYFQFRSVY